MMNSFKKKNREVKPILKDKDKEDKGLTLQLVPEYVDKRTFQQGTHNPNYVFAGALYIPRDIIQIVNASDTGAAQIHTGTIKDGENVFQSDDQSVAIEDPDVRKYISRILRYFKYDPDEAMATLREASFKIKNRARGVVKRTYSQNTVTKLQAWRAKVQYSEGESDEDLFNPSHPVFGPKTPITEEEGKDDLYNGEIEEVNKRSFIQKTFTRLFPTKSSMKIDKSNKEISSSDTPYSSEGERSSRKNKWKSKMSKSMSQIINEGNKQVTGSSVKKTSLKSVQSLSKQDELLLRYLTAPRIHHCDTYTVMLLRNENNQNIRSHSRKKALKKMKKRLQRLDTLPYHRIELDNNPCSTFDRIARNTNVLRFKEMSPNQERFVCCQPFQSYNALDNRTDRRDSEEAMRQSVDIIADTFVDIIESPNDPKCKVEITGHGYKGKFNVGLDPIIDEVLYNSLQNLKETYENARDYFQTPNFDRRRNRTLSNIADNVRNYLKSKVSGRNTIRSSAEDQFSSENVNGRISSQRVGRDHYIECMPRVIYRDVNMKRPRHRPNRKRSCAPLKKISKYFIDNEKFTCQPNHINCNNVQRQKKKRNMISSESDSFEERQYIRRVKGPTSPEIESSDDSFILKETSSTLDDSIRSLGRECSAANEVNKKKTSRTREIPKQSCYPDLSYITENDWKAATELLKREREHSILSIDKSGPVRYMLNEKEGEKLDQQISLNNPTGNKKVVKMKETMTTTANGVTTVTQTELIEAVNQSSQCIIPSSSKDALVGRREFNRTPMTQNETRREESVGRLTKGPYRHRNLEEITVPYKKGANNEVYRLKNKEYSLNLGYHQSRYSRSYEALDEKHLNSTLTIGEVASTGKNKSHGYKDISVANNIDQHCQNNSEKYTWRNDHSHCIPVTVNNYALPREISTMTPHPEITDFQQNTQEGSRRKILLLHRVYSDPTITCQNKPHLNILPKVVDDKMQIEINAMTTDIEREYTPFNQKKKLQHRIRLEKSEKQDSQMAEEVIVTGKGRAKIRVSLGPCDRTQRQQAFLELMEELKRRLESENQLLTNPKPFHAVTFHDLNECSPMQIKAPTPLKKIEKGTFADMNETLIMRSSMKECCDKICLRHDRLKDCDINTKKINSLTVCCKRPCYCDEKGKENHKETSVEKDIPRKSRTSKIQSLKQEDVSKPKIEAECTSAYTQTDDLVKVQETEEKTDFVSSKLPSLNQEDVAKPKMEPKSTSVYAQTDDFEEVVDDQENKQKTKVAFSQTDNLTEIISPKISTTESSLISDNNRYSTAISSPKSRTTRTSIPPDNSFQNTKEKTDVIPPSRQTDDLTVISSPRTTKISISPEDDKNLTMISSPKSSTTRTSISSEENINLTVISSPKSRRTRTSLLSEDNGNMTAISSPKSSTTKKSKSSGDNINFPESRTTEPALLTEDNRNLTVIDSPESRKTIISISPEDDRNLTMISSPKSRSPKSSIFSDENRNLTVISLPHSKSTNTSLQSERNRNSTIISLPNAKSTNTSVQSESNIYSTVISSPQSSTTESFIPPEENRNLTVISSPKSSLTELSTHSEDYRNLPEISLPNSKAINTSFYPEMNRSSTVTSLPNSKAINTSFYPEMNRSSTVTSLPNSKAINTSFYPERNRSSTVTSLPNSKAINTSFYPERNRSSTVTSLPNSKAINTSFYPERNRSSYLKNTRKPKVISVSSQTDNLSLSNMSYDKKRKSSRRSEQPSRVHRTSESRIKTGSLFSKSLNEKNSLKASRLLRSRSVSSENLSKEIFLEESKITIRKKKEKLKKPRNAKKEKKETTRKSSRKNSVLTNRGTLFVRRSSAPLVDREPSPRRSSIINQRVWIQNLSAPGNYADKIVADVKKKETTEPSEASILNNLKEISNIYFSSESDNSIVNLNLKKTLKRRMSNNTFINKKRNFFSQPHKSKDVQSIQEIDKKSIGYCTPKQSKGEKFIVAPKRKFPPKSGIIDSFSYVHNRKTSSDIDIITNPNTVDETSSKFSSDTSFTHLRKSTDYTSSDVSKYAKKSIISFESAEKSSCSLLSYEETPSLIKYVENIKQLPSESPTVSDNSTNDSTSFIKRRVECSKYHPVGKSTNHLNDTGNRSNMLPGDCLQNFPEPNKDIELVLGPSKTTKEHSMESPPDRTSGEAKPPITTGSKHFRRKKSTSSESSDSRTTVICGPIVYKKRLAMCMQNLMSKRTGALDPQRSNKSSDSSKRKSSSTESSTSGEKGKSFKSRFKRFNSRPFMRRSQPDHSKVKNQPVVERISPDTDSSDGRDSFQNYKQLDNYQTDSPAAQKSIERLKKDSTISEVVVEAVLDTMTTKRCITETVDIKKHEGKPRRGKKSTKPCNLNSTICINDECVQSTEVLELEEANCTTIGFDRSDVSLKKGNSKISQCYKFRTTDETICSSTAWIINSSESDLESNATHTEYIHKHSKISGQNEDRSNTEFVMVMTQSSSELLTKKRSPKRTFIHRKHTFISNEFKPCETSRKFFYTLSRKKRNTTSV